MGKGKHPVLGNVSMKRHAKSGTPHNHAHSIANVREFNRKVEQEKLLREKRKPKMFNSIKELFSN